MHKLLNSFRSVCSVENSKLGCVWYKQLPRNVSKVTVPQVFPSDSLIPGVHRVVTLLSQMVVP